LPGSKSRAVVDPPPATAAGKPEGKTTARRQAARPTRSGPWYDEDAPRRPATNTPDRPSQRPEQSREAGPRQGQQSAAPAKPAAKKQVLSGSKSAIMVDPSR
jgi:hypothetical protein